MEEYQAVLLGVWREACRHIDIGESAGTIARMLVRELPIDQVLVGRLNPNQSCVETVALGWPQPDHVQLPARPECSAVEMRKLSAWCGRREIAVIEATAQPAGIARTVLSDGIDRDVMLGPLAASGGSLGLLVLVAHRGKSFTSRHRVLMDLLLDPFSVALENDTRLREMQVLKEAAEADKLSLLTRMGRDGITDTIVGAQSGLREVMDRVELVARSNAPVLIFGETGSGKELIARAIHKRSPRAQGAFIRVNCGAIPPELIDSQLFGHERGAFTGAARTHKGWFERADGGSLLLDEIAELPPAAQVRLLRVLQDGWLERVGGLSPIHVDVRIIAATHRDLAAMVSDGRFREDLWYRITVFPMVLPPLRTRIEDIPELARHFAGRAARRFGIVPVMPTAEDVELLTTYNWPGNVRELAAVIDRAAILGDGRCLEVRKALGITDRFARLPTDGTRADTTGNNGELAHVSLNETIKRHIESALHLSKGRVDGPDGAAALLRINPNTLRAKMCKLGIERVRFVRN